MLANVAIFLKKKKRLESVIAKAWKKIFKAQYLHNIGMFNNNLVVIELH